MHEIYVAGEILKEIESEASHYANSRVRVVKLLVGTYAGIDLSSLRFALEAISPGTIIEGADVAIEGGASDIVCSTCGRTATRAPRNGKAQCPRCGLLSAIEPGMEIYIEEMELHGEEDYA